MVRFDLAAAGLVIEFFALQHLHLLLSEDDAVLAHKCLQGL
jgi:hypothetical protein